MRKSNIFLILLVISLISLIILFLVMIFVIPSIPSVPDWRNDMWGHMGGMMGGMGQTTDPYLFYFGILFAIIIVLVIGSAIGLAYFIFFPKIEKQKLSDKNQINRTLSKSSAYESVFKTLTNDERKVLQVLEIHGGKYLQKYIRSESGLSRLKIHRILARFAERGIVTLKKTGNTNEVILAEWLK